MWLCSSAQRVAGELEEVPGMSQSTWDMKLAAVTTSSTLGTRDGVWAWGGSGSQKGRSGWPVTLKASQDAENRALFLFQEWRLVPSPDSLGRQGTGVGAGSCLCA